MCWPSWNETGGTDVPVPPGGAPGSPPTDHKTIRQPQHLCHLKPVSVRAYDGQQRQLATAGGSFVKVQRIISFATLAISIFTLVLVLRRPAAVAPAVAPA